MIGLINTLQLLAEVFDELCHEEGKCEECRGCEPLIEGYSIADFLNAIMHIDDKEYIKRKIEVIK